MSLGEDGARAGALGLVTRTGGVLLAWALVLAAENVGVGLTYRDVFAGSWEMALARRALSPLLLAALVPAAVVLTLVAQFLARADADAWRRKVAMGLGAVTAAALGYGITFGRHFASWAARAPFIAVLALAGGLALGWGAPRLAVAARTRPTVVALVGVAGAAGCWWADAHVLPRLYPAFHAALFGGVLVAAAALVLPLRKEPFVRYASWAALAVGVVSAARARASAVAVRSADNLRMVLVEHAPLLGRGASLAAWLAPPLEDDAPAEGAQRPGPARALDWTGRDILLVSIDALRADHVGAYGYARRTTPNLDALAREGATFRAAYCPTPHTSYSVTSMMTGKYMRPLLALGVGEDSETWAAYARRYGYRTAAFYPPAVFFIDAARFGRFEERGLDFEYRKVEFASPKLRGEQIDAYLATAPAAAPLFLWVHLFEPHEPYVMHAEHPFGAAGSPTDVDAYDSEIALADEGLGAIVTSFRRARPGAVVVITADHGEEFGEHGGRYHGTTVYEEQVRVPLVVVGPGVPAQDIGAPVQTIDLLPTVLSALGVPRPPRIRGRDLGPLLAQKDVVDAGAAFAETDDYTLYARGAERLVCARKAAACSLYDIATDPGETHDLSTEREAAARELRKATRALVRDAARYEAGEGADLPEALRRGLMGDVDAAPDVAALLDDARVELRRRAAEVLFRLHVRETAPALARALARDEDVTVKRFAAVALVRVRAAARVDAGEADAGAEEGVLLVAALLTDADVAWRRRAALAFAEHGDARGETELLKWWAAEGPPAAGGAGLGFEDARELLDALVRTHARDAAALLVKGLADVRLRQYIATALGELGDPRAKGALLAAFAEERYVSARGSEARALVALGARAELAAPLARFAGLPEPMPDAVEIAGQAGLLVAEHGGWLARAPVPVVDVALVRPRGPSRLLVQVGGDGGVKGTCDGATLAFTKVQGGSVAEVSVPDAGGAKGLVHVEAPGGVRALWLVAASEELPPPPPRAWRGADGSDGGTD